MLALEWSTTIALVGGKVTIFRIADVSLSDVVQLTLPVMELLATSL